MAGITEKARTFAKEKHSGATDKGGAPYFSHVDRVAGKFLSPYFKAVAYLHDILEDTDVTVDDLLDEGFPYGLVRHVVMLTRKDGEIYADYIARIKTDPVATAVKVEDLLDNMDLTRLKEVTDRDRARVDGRYRKALEFLRSTD